MKSSALPLIARFTAADELRNKSFIVLIILAALAMLVLRGCSGGDVTVNGQRVQGDQVKVFVSKAQFHVIGGATLLLTALLAMGVLRRDRDAGVTAATLSRPVSRCGYITGKALGLWLLCSAIMVLLHLLLYVLTWLTTPSALPALLGGSLLCSLNLLLVVLAVMALSLLMPEVVAFLVMAAVVAVGIGIEIATGVAGMMQASSGRPISHPLLTFLDLVWPKLPGLQALGANLLGAGLPPVTAFYPVLNVALWTTAAAFLLVWKFRHTDVG